MSYILDALKKADAERERGTVPGLHSQHMGQEDEDDDDAPARTLSPLVWVGAGVGLCVIALLSWKLLSRETPPEVMSSPQAAPDVATATAPSMQPAVPPAQPAQPTQPTQPARMKRDQVPPPVSPPMERALAQPHNAPPPLAREARQAAVAPPPAPAVMPRAAPNTTGSGPAAPARIPTLSELPDDVRRDIPQLVIGGAMYSETPSSRMLIINSQVFHEGDQPYQGLVLEEIRLKSAVFKYRSYRYSVNY